MQDYLWQNSFKKIPKWRCPNCPDGQLHTLSNRFHVEEADYSKTFSEANPEWTTEKFIALLKCDSDDCGEVVCVAGERITEYGPDEEGHNVLETFLSPTYVHPAPHLIPVSKNLPEGCKCHLLASFELFWVDAAACANRLRVFIEKLMDHFMVPSEVQKSNGKKRRLDLSERIKKFGEAHPNHEDALTALRHVGNRGTHEGETDRKALLVCYELLEAALSELVDARASELSAKALSLIATKGLIEKTGL